MRLKRSHYVLFAIWASVGIILCRLAYAWDAVPFKFGEFLHFRGEIWEPFVTAWPLFALGIVINIYKLSSTVNPPEIQKDARKLPLSGFFASVMAGVMEELTFRWVLFFGFIGLFWVVDKVLLSGVVSNYIIGTGYTINRLITVGSTKYATDPATWAIGLAMLAANWKFQEGHSYQGTSGRIFSFIGGWFFFIVMFKHGLYASMLVHFAFDMLAFLMLMVDIAFEKALGLTNANNKIYKWY